ncbi:MAG: DNA polymerase I [Candidatus Woesebacteria bacterium]|jgi:DNA polymerase-1
MKRLVIIDGKSVFYRGYYAMPNLTTKDGTPTGGVYGFAMMALEVVKKLKPDYVCVAWDKAKTNIRARTNLYPAYKGNRKPAPDDFYAQIPILHELLHALDWPLYELDDYEADDIMGAFAKQAGEQGIESYLVTSDLDVLQLVNRHTHIYTLKKGLSNIELFNEATFKEKYGVDAHQWVDVKALKGDASDNIPGVAGVGEKTALDLIKTYGNLDEVYANLDNLRPVLRAKLEKDKDMAYLSKKLVTLMVDAPIELDLSHAKLNAGLTPEFTEMLRKLEFKTLLRQAEAALPKEAIVESEVQKGYELQPAKQTDFVAMDYLTNESRVIALNPEATEFWVSKDAQSFSAINIDDLSLETTKLLASSSVVGHDLKNVFRSLLAFNLPWNGEVMHDTKIGAFLLDCLQRQRELSDLIEQPVDVNDAGAVIAAIWKAYKDQRSQLDDLTDIKRLSAQIEFPCIKLLANIEHRGILLNSDYLAQMSQKFDVRIKEFEQKIYELAGQEFNISSPSQLATVLFEKMGLPTQGIKKGKTGYSTGASELDKLRGLHPIADLITNYRELTKLKNTYIDALPKLVDVDGRLHTTFNLDVTATGRLSSQNPNLQNIPTRTEIGQAIRSAFVPDAGNVFVSADYSQFELRLAAVMADDKKLIDEFNSGVDIHTATVAEVYGVPVQEVTKQQRRNAKVVNFGVLYGMSPHGLAAATGMTRDEAKVFIDKYFELRAPIKKYMDQIVADALQKGYVQTIFGRRRPTPDLKSSNFMVREGAKRAAINMPIQGTEADLMKMAMLKLEDSLGDLGQQILQIHDSIMVECPKANAKKVEEILKNTMQNVYELPVKLDVDIKTGENWGEI